MSCSLHDVMRLEELGVATALLVSDAFRRSVAEQAPLLGLGAYEPVWVQHPVAGLRAAAVQGRADEVVAEVARVLLGLPAPPALAPPAPAPPVGPAGALSPGSPTPAEEDGPDGRPAGPDCTDAACAIDLSELGR